MCDISLFQLNCVNITAFKKYFKVEGKSVYLLLLAFIKIILVIHLKILKM